MEIRPCKICQYNAETISHMSYTNDVDHDMVDFEILQCPNYLCKWNIYLFLHQNVEIEKLISRNLLEQMRYKKAVISCLGYKQNLFYTLQPNERHFDCVVKLWNFFHTEESPEIKQRKKAWNVHRLEYTDVNILTDLDLDL